MYIRVQLLETSNLQSWTKAVETLSEKDLSEFFLISNEGLPGVLGNKGTKGKYRREHGDMTPVLGNAGT